LKHGTTTVIPDKPGKPGEPINPNDPDGPKWPDTTGKDNLSKTGTQTIHYTGAGNNTPKDNVQSFTFTRTAVVDNVTGKVISTGAWNVTSHTFGNVDTPVVEGYHADKRTAGNTTITPEDLNKIVTVNYTANGKIIPVDPNGKPIPNVPTPTYPTDPNDPTKVVPNEPVPTIPGYKPSVPTVTPSDPGKDTPVPYAPQTTPVTPNIPVTPNEPSTPTTPDTSAPTPHGEDVPVTPNEPDTPAPAPHGEKPEEPDRPAPAPHAPKAPTAKGNNTPEKEDKTVPTAAAVVKNEQTPEAELPQTGEKNDSAAAILGATAGMIGLIGLSGVKKKKS
jgi:LPXTG-motif cell wall-anchored protein